MPVQHYVQMFKRQPLLLWAAVVSVTAEMGIAATVPIVPRYLKEGLDVEGVLPGVFGEIFPGIVISAFLVAETLLKSPAGMLSDRIGRKRTILCGLLLAIVASILMSLTRHPLPFLLLTPCLGVAVALTWVPLSATYVDLSEESHRAGALGIVTLAYLVGIIFGYAAGLHLWQLFEEGWVTFLLTASLLVFASAVVGLRFPSRIPTRLRTVTGREDIERDAKEGTGIEDNRRRMTLLVLVGLTTIVLQFAISLLFPAAQDYVLDELKWSKDQLGLFVGITATLLAVTALPLSRLGDHLPRTLAVQLALTVGAVGMFTAPHLRFLIPMVVLAWFMGAAWVVAFPAILALTGDIAHHTQRGSAIGLVTTAQGIGAIAGPPLGLLLFKHLGKSSPFYASAGALVVAGVISYMLTRALRQAKTVDGEKVYEVESPSGRQSGRV